MVYKVVWFAHVVPAVGLVESAIIYFQMLDRRMLIFQVEHDALAFSRKNRRQNQNGNLSVGFSRSVKVHLVDADAVAVTVLRPRNYQIMSNQQGRYFR